IPGEVAATFFARHSHGLFGGISAANELKWIHVMHDPIDLSLLLQRQHDSIIALKSHDQPDLIFTGRSGRHHQFPLIYLNEVMAWRESLA
ncbi:hypothetical protein ACFTRB_20790, partial [Bacillus velezensis]